MTCKNLISEYIHACGPVSFKEIKQEVKTQSAEKWEDYQIAQILTELIQEKDIELGDEGTTFQPY